MALENAEVRRARTFLAEREVSNISPRRFAAAAQELSLNFTKLLALIMRLRMGGQGQGPAPIAQRIAEKEAA